MWSEGAQVKLYRERCVPNVLKLSSEVSECKALDGGFDFMEEERAHNPPTSMVGRCRLALSNPR